MNVYLSQEERKAALVLSRSLAHAKEAFQKGERNKDALLTIVKNEIEEEPMSDINYVEMYEMPGLAELPETIEGNALLAVAVRFGKTRLIDNVIPRQNNDLYNDAWKNPPRNRHGSQS